MGELQESWGERLSHVLKSPFILLSLHFCRQLPQEPGTVPRRLVVPAECVWALILSISTELRDQHIFARLASTASALISTEEESSKCYVRRGYTRVCLGAPAAIWEGLEEEEGGLGVKRHTQRKLFWWDNGSYFNPAEGSSVSYEADPLGKVRHQDQEPFLCVCT